MSIEAARLSVVVDADTKGAEDGLGRMHGVVGKAGIGLAALGASGVAAGGVLAGFAVNSAMSIEDAFAPIGTLLGADSAAYADLSSKLKDFTAISPTSADELGMAAYMGLSSGIKGTSNVMDALANSQDLALAGLGDVGGSMDLITSAMNSFTSEGLNSTSAAQMFFGTVASGKTTTSDLAQGFGQLAPMAAGMGVKFNDLMAATAALTSTGMSASTAYGGIKGALTAIVAPTADAAKTAEALGLQFSQAHLAAVGLPKFLDEVKVATGGNVTTMASLFGGVEGLNTVMALTGPQAEAFTANLTGIGEAGMTLADKAADMNSTTSNQFAQMKNQAMIALGGIGQKVIDYLLPKVKEVTGWIKDNWPRISATFREVMAAVMEAWETKGRPALDKIIEIGQFVADWWVAHWPVISKTVQDVMNAIGDIITNVLDLIETIWDSYGSKIVSLVNDVWSFISGTIAAAMDVIRGVIDVVMGLIHGDWSRVWDGIKGILVGVWDAIKVAISAALDSLKFFLGVAWEFIKDAVDNVWQSIKGVILGVWDGIVGAVKMYIATVISIMQKCWDTITGAVKWVWQGIKNTISGVWDGIVGIVSGIGSRISGVLGGIADLISKPFKAAFNAIADLWNNTVGKLSFHVPSWVPIIGGKGFDVPDIPKFHSGGTVPGRPGTDVLAMLQAGEMVLTAQQQTAIRRQASTTSSAPPNVFQINVSATAGRERLAGDEVVKAILAYERSNGRIFTRASERAIA